MILLAVASVLCVLFSSPASSAYAAPLLGLGDNQITTLQDPVFQATQIKRMRVLVPYDDIAYGKDRLANMDIWMATAKNQGIEPLVSFYRTYSCPVKCALKRLPSKAGYRQHFRAFRARYPWIRHYATWNEANFSFAQPTGRNPRRTAAFYRIARSECRKQVVGGGRCSVLTADYLANGTRASKRWLKTFKRHIGPGPHRWGLVSHPDVNRFTAKRTRWFLRQTRGPVWISEIGALNQFAKVFEPSIRRQTRVMRYLLGPYSRVSSRIKRMYIYHWRDSAYDDHWDSGLFDQYGVPRPIFNQLLKKLGRPALPPQAQGTPPPNRDTLAELVRGITKPILP